MTTLRTPVAAPPALRRGAGPARPGPVPGAGLPRQVGRSRGMTGSAVVAAVGIVLIAADVEIAAGMTVGTLLTLALLPVWLPTAALSNGYRWLAVLTVVGVCTGALLTGLASDDHVVSVRVLVELVLLVVGMVTATGWYLWSRHFLPAWSVGALFGIGLCAAIRPGEGLFAESPWKFGFSLPVSVLLLSLAWRTGSRWFGAAVTLVLAAVSALTDARSLFAMLLLTAVLVVWQGRRTAVSTPRSVVRVLLLFAGLGYVAYIMGEAFILEGYLGAETQQRTQAQIDASGSLLLGGRPEAAATLALIRENPIGYGAGTIPAVHDILVAKSGMSSINYDPNNGYVENYMFGGHFEVHSMLGDLWIWFGPAGAALAVAVLVVAGRGLATRIATRSASALIVFLVVRTAWNVAFSPVLNAVPSTALALGLLLAVHHRADRSDAAAIAEPEALTAPVTGDAKPASQRSGTIGG